VRADFQKKGDGARRRILPSPALLHRDDDFLILDKPAGLPVDPPRAGGPSITAPAGWRMVVDPAGHTAVTDWRVLGGRGGRTWLELSPRTGRTHQLRAHCAHLGCPILGDARYGAAPGPALHLLARAILVPTTPPIAATATIPAHMRDVLRACGWRG